MLVAGGQAFAQSAQNVPTSLSSLRVISASPSGIYFQFGNLDAITTGIHAAQQIYVSKDTGLVGSLTEGLFVSAFDNVGIAGSYLEGIRTAALAQGNISGAQAQALVAVSGETAGSSHTYLIGTESEVDSLSGDAPLPASFLLTHFSTSYLADTGKVSAGTNKADAGFMTNPTAGQAGFQTGFLNAGGTAYAAFADIGTQPWGIDLAFGSHATGAIRIKNGENISFDNAAHSTTYPSILFDAVNALELGTNSSNLYVQSTAMTVNGTLFSAGDITAAGAGTGLAVTNNETVGGTSTITGNISTPAHFLNTSAVPALSACGTSPAVNALSSNTSGIVSTGTGTPTTCTATFATAYPNVAFCTATPFGTTQPTSWRVSATSSVGFTITYAPAANTQSFVYICGGN